ncbi:MAG: dienelactone hydrolase [Planctomycetota bacterium]|jgi:dienelactone hydrolase
MASKSNFTLELEQQRALSSPPPPSKDRREPQEHLSHKERSSCGGCLLSFRLKFMNPTILIAVSIFAAPLSAAAPMPATAPPAVAVLARSTKVEPKVITFKTEDGIELTADYYEPSSKSGGTASRTPAAILVHDAGGNRGQMSLFADRLHKQGLAVLVPDFRGHGASATKDLDWTTKNDKERESIWSFTPRDLDAATKWLQSRDEVHGTNITLVGLRAGCALSVYHAGRESKIRAVVLIEPAAKSELGFDLRREMARLGGLTTKVFTPREKEDDAVSIQMDSTEANDGLEFVEIDLCSSKGEDLIHDRRVASNVAKWVKDIAFPKRGRGRN